MVCKSVNGKSQMIILEAHRSVSVKCIWEIPVQTKRLKNEKS